MKISEKDWKNYISRLRKVNDLAAQKVADYMTKVDINTAEGMKQLLDYSYAVATRYGEAATELACQMYDAVAAVSKVSIPSAEPAETATYGEVIKAVKGKMFDTKDPSAVGSAVGRLVKMAGVDTTMKNALRDGAEWAWIPSGDTCAFCLMLASRGWQKASRSAIRNGHAEHIHHNCDCTYQIRFDESLQVEGYDPDALYDEYIGAGETRQERLNSIRRKLYAKNPDYYRAQKRAAYRKRKSAAERERMRTKYSNKVQIKALDAEGYVEKFKGITGIDDVDNAVYNSAVEILNHRNGTDFEDLHLIDAKTGEVICKLTTCDIKNGVEYDAETKAAIKKAHAEHREIIAVHNHPGGLPPSLDDGVSAYNHGYAKGVAAGHNMEVYIYGKADNYYSEEYCKMIHEAINDRIRYDIEFDDTIWYNALEKHGMEVSRK